ncbi:MAG: Glu-tRNA(Gln) amidotransferase subunit GatE [Candidatus Woesearchaeota archaeon]
MTNHKDLGFKSGLEVHYQLSTRKLFCHCPNLINDPNPINFEVSRKLRAFEGELGKKDIAAKYEETKNKIFIYKCAETSSCLVELDECPPYPINQDTIKVAIQVATLLNMKTVDEIIIMRKLVIDGSNPSGYQRTALIARDGFIETSKGRIRIPTLYLEEDAAKKISTDKDTTTYELSRLGIPLLEIATAPNLKDPKHVKETAEKIGMIVKSTGKARRGIGAVRQDVNISIKGQKRVELKGFQDLRSIPKVIEIEIQRQLKNKKEEAHVRKVEPNFTTSYLRPMPGSSRLYPDTDLKTFPLTNNFLKSIEIPELITERSLNFEKKYKISAQYAREILKQNIPFDYYAEKYKIEPKFIAHLLLEVPKELKSRFSIKKDPKKEHFDFILENLQRNNVPKEASIEILKDLLTGNKPDLSKFSTVSLGELEDFIKDLVQKNKGVSIGGLMGDIMKKYRGTVDGQLVMKILKKYHK